MRALKFASGLWNLPNTLLGFLLGGLNLSLPALSHGAANYYFRRSWTCWVCRVLRIRAFTLGDCVFYAGCAASPEIRVHESRHIWQYHMLGPFFLPVYFLLLAAFGYNDHPFERDARRYEREEIRRLTQHAESPPAPCP